ncbi:MAG: hypothetical protein NDJ89_01905 [Oligoflexia bacterium]|nr:hypothetical protein [Oligoflexia bacterium]
MSKHLNPSQIKAIEKIGDALIPGEQDFPRFSETSCVRDLDRVLDYMPAQDLGDLKTLLSILALFPLAAVRALMRLLELAFNQAVPGGGLLRLIRIGLRGLIFTLYYSDPRVVERVGYHVDVYTADLAAEK